MKPNHLLHPYASKGKWEEGQEYVGTVQNLDSGLWALDQTVDQTLDSIMDSLFRLEFPLPGDKGYVNINDSKF